MRTIFISALGCAGLVLAACGGNAGDGDGPTIVATTGIAAELTERAAGEEIEVDQLIPDSASPHDFQLSASDRQLLEEADLIVSIGGGLEAGLPLDDVDTPQWALTEHAGELLPFRAAGAHEDEHSEETAESEDPHVWMDPTRVSASLPSLAAALSDAVPGATDAVRRRAREYAAELEQLDHELRSTMKPIAAEDRELITSHDSLGYFADRYGFEVVATAFPATGAEAEASAEELDEVLTAISEHAVPAVFAQQGDDPRTLELLAGEAGVEIETGLLVEAPADAGSYEEMLRRDAELIAAALAG